MVRKSDGLLALVLLGALWSGPCAAQTALDPSLRVIGEMSSYRFVCNWFKEPIISDQDADRAARLLAKSVGIDFDDRKTQGVLRQWNKFILAEYSGRLAGDQFRWCATLARKIVALTQKDS
jgi:hypothetical protein